jgi:hypothetical protein
MVEIVERQEATPAQKFVQKTGVLITKACLSSIPLASLAFDAGQLIVDLANERIANKFLTELARRVDCLESEIRENLRSDPLHEIAAHKALQSLSSETSETVAAVLARAVALLPTIEQSKSFRAQCARVLSELNEITLHAMQTNERHNEGMLTDEELRLCDWSDDKNKRIAALLNATLFVPDWSSVMRRIRELGLIEQHYDGGDFSNDPMVEAAPSTPYGKLILDLCFDDVSIPLFGKFASISIDDKAI